MASIEKMTDEELLSMNMPGERSYVMPDLQDPLLQKRGDVIEDDINPDNILAKSMDAEPVYQIGEPDIEDGFVDRVVRGAERVGSGAKGVYQGLDALATDIMQFPVKYAQDPLGEGAKIEQEAVELAKGVLAGDPEAQEKALIATSMSMVEPAATAADVELARRDIGKAIETRDPGDIATAGVSTVFAAIPLVGVGLTKSVTKAAPDAPEPVFESVLEKAVVEKMPNKVSVDDVEKFLNKKGATKSEIADTKVPEFVEQAKAAGKKSVTKNEVIKHLDENKVQIEEVRLDESVQKIPEEIKDLGDQRYVAFESLNEEASSLARVLAPDNTASSQVDKFLDNPFHFDKLYINYVGGINRIRRFDDVPDDMQDAVTSVVSLDTFKEIRLWEPEDAARITKARNVINAKLADPEYQKFFDQQYEDFRAGPAAGFDEDSLAQATKNIEQRDNLRTIARILNEMPEAETQLALLRQFQASPKYQEYSRLSKDYREKYSAFQMEARRSSRTAIYKKYSVPHGDNYQEILLTVPRKKLPQDDDPLVQKLLDAGPSAKGVLTAEEIQTLDRRYKVNKDSFGRLRERKSAETHLWNVFDSKSRGWPLKQGFRDSHHDEIPNVLAHIRTKDRFDHKGRKILFVEEIQSDWHQAGRKKGYDDDKIHIIDIDGNVVKKVDNESAAKQYIREVQDRAMSTGKPLQDGGPEDLDYKMPGTRPYLVPDAPLKDTKEWTALAVRRVFREAADKGYDGVAFSRADMITPVVTLPGDQAFEALGDRDSFISILSDMRQRGGQYAEAADEAERVFKGNEYYYDKLLPSIARKESKGDLGTTLIELKDVGFSKVKERHTPGMSYPQFNTQVERLADSGWVQEVPFFEITPKVKEKVSKPQKLYEAVIGAGAGGAAARFMREDEAEDDG